MAINVTMPRLSDTMEAGTVVKWNVKEGDKVSVGDVLADIETDKATMELEAFDDGVVAKLAAQEGEQVSVGDLILVIAEDGEDPDEAAKGGGEASSDKAEEKSEPKEKGKDEAKSEGKAKAEGSDDDEDDEDEGGSTKTAVSEKKGTSSAASSAPASSGGSGSSNGSAGGRIFASPLARKIAEEKGIDLSAIEGSGPSGRIVRKDVEAAAEGGKAETKARDAERAAPEPLPPLGATLEAKSVPLSNMRSTIAKRLVESKQSIPHYQVTIEVDMDALLELREQLNTQLESQGVKLSVNDFLVRACALAMHQHPFVNASWGKDGKTIEINAEVNVGVAIALPVKEDLTGGGLVVATLRHADRIGLRQISTETRRLAKKAREKGLTTEELSGSTFTISNLGMFGVDHFTAIINPPNTAILAVGRAAERPVVRDGQIVVGHVMAMTMSSDHRVIDGAMAAQYLQTVKELLEAPATLLV
ncbi:MAG: pyruvate dehydrogenase complex dihydrolipoamide acetyltransferase [Phycisphaerales bacterium]|nr:MAG: pyruvate dehydrogenase complex dihydrolipoamide acetyltransferase [Phycisphaerales bacterium]